MSYSQYGQDTWVLDLLGENGFFLDIGSYDPIEYSNTYLLEKEHNWKGICIEAQEDECKKYSNIRNCIIINALVDSEIYDAQFIVYKGLSGIIKNFSEFDKNRLLNKTQFKGKKLEDLSINIRTSLLVDILKQCEIPNVIDYVSLDIEGSELRVLKTFPWDKFHINTMTIEHNRLPEYFNEIRTYMKSKDFIVLGNYLSDNEDCFINKTIKRVIHV